MNTHSPGIVGRLRRQDVAFYTALVTAGAAVWFWQEPVLALGLAGLAVGAVAGSRYWSRRYPAPFPHSQRWVLPLGALAHPAGALLRALAPEPGERVLELGPGTGRHAVAVARAIGTDGVLDVVDIQEAMLDSVTKRASKHGVDNIAATCCDAADLPFAEATFDAAYAMTMLGEIPDRAAALRTIARVLKPGGRLVVAEMFLDPDFIAFDTLVAQCTAAGLTFDKRFGSKQSYFARFTR